MVKEYAFMACDEINLGAPFYNVTFSNGPPNPPHCTGRYPQTDLQAYLAEGWTLLKLHIHRSCGMSAEYRFVLERPTDTSTEGQK